MLHWICIDNNTSQKILKFREDISDALGGRSWATFLLLPRFDVIFDV